MRRKAIALALCFCFGGVASQGFAQTLVDGPKAEKIHKLLKTYHEFDQFNGSALVADRGEVIYKSGHGLANMEWNIPNEPSTRFRLGSITKQFTAMLIMQLVQEGKIDLQAPMTKYLPDYRKDTGDRVTVHQLLAHTSGIPSYTSQPEFREKVSRDPYAVGEFSKEYCSGDLEFEPGSTFRYNNSGYFLLGAVIEQVTGQRYEDVLRERIFAPLKMNSSGYDHHATVLKKRASGYEQRFNGFVNAPYLDMSIPYAAGSLYSTVEDLYLWDRALYTDQLLNELDRNIMFTPVLQGYGYGWGIRKMVVGEEKKNVTMIGHGGGIHGFNTNISRIVEDQHLIVLLNNTGGQPLREMTQEIVNILYDRPYKLPSKPIVSELVQAALTQDKSSAVAMFHAWRENNQAKARRVEGQLNNAGYGFLQAREKSKAVKVFELNVALFPASANVYDSLGEAQAAQGKLVESITNYKKSLELDPMNEGAKSQIKTLQDKLDAQKP